MILDCEIVPCDNNNNIIPFQNISTIVTRKLPIDKSITPNLLIIPFDILYLNDKSITNITLKNRIDILQNNIKEDEKIFFPKQYIENEMYIKY